MNGINNNFNNYRGRQQGSSYGERNDQSVAQAQSVAPASNSESLLEQLQAELMRLRLEGPITRLVLEEPIKTETLLSLIDSMKNQGMITIDDPFIAMCMDKIGKFENQDDSSIDLRLALKEIFINDYQNLGTRMGAYELGCLCQVIQSSSESDLLDDVSKLIPQLTVIHQEDLTVEKETMTSLIEGLKPLFSEESGSPIDNKISDIIDQAILNINIDKINYKDGEIKTLFLNLFEEIFKNTRSCTDISFQRYLCNIESLVSFTRTYSKNDRCLWIDLQRFIQDKGMQNRQCYLEYFHRILYKCASLGGSSGRPDTIFNRGNITLVLYSADNGNLPSDLEKLSPQVQRNNPRGVIYLLHSELLDNGINMLDYTSDSYKKALEYAKKMYPQQYSRVMYP